MSHTVLCMVVDQGVCILLAGLKLLDLKSLGELPMNGHRRRQRASRPRRAIFLSLANAAALVASPGVARAQALPDPLSGTYAVNATSGSAVLTGNSTLQGTVTLDLRFLAEYLIVGGGGGGGPTSTASPGGGGGGGRVIFDDAFVINTPQTFTIEVGQGGQGGTGGNNTTTGSAATSGGPSRFGDVIAAGGGRGGWGGVGTTAGAGAAGGSGGGAGRNPSISTTTGGAASGSLGLGNAGGTVFSPASSTLGGAGGGGATAAGADPPGTGSGGGDGGNGGEGFSSEILGTSDVFGSGGGGGARGGGNPLVIAVNGAGGTNAGSGGKPGDSGFSGVANRGGGGGGGQRAPVGASSDSGTDGGAGGSGIVVVRYQGAPVAGSSGGVAGTGSAAGYTVHSYTSGSTLLDFTGLNLDQRLGATLSGNLSGTGSLSYAGPGRLTLTGTSSYSGSTTVTAGTLVVNGTLSETSLVTVGAAGTLGGSGVIAAGVTAAGVVAPGNSIGTLTTDDFLLSGTLANELARFDNGSSILPVSDLVDVTGTVTLNDADLSLSLWTGSGYSQPTLGDIFYLIANDGIDAISGVFTSLNGVPTTLAEGSEFSWNSQQWKITYQADYTGSYEGSSFTGGNDAAIIVVPEPTALAGAATGISLLGLFVRRFRRRSQRPSPHQIV